MSKIPEATVIDLQLQADLLETTFGGTQRDNFNLVRGMCGNKLLTVTDVIMRDENGSPKALSHGVKDLKAFFDALAIIRNKIAQLERDGFTLAAHEAREALKRPGYRMLGEIKSFKETVPVTLVVPNPKYTLAALTARVAFEGVEDEEWVVKNDLPKDLHLEFYTKECDGHSTYDVFRRIYQLSEPLIKQLFRAIPKKCITVEPPRSSIHLPYFSLQKRGCRKMPNNILTFAFCAPKEVILRCFSHEEHEKIALWEFNLPKTYIRKRSEKLCFGLHAEAEHAYWRKTRAPFCSTNVAHGYGAIAYPGEAYHCFDERSKRFKETRILLY